MNIRNEGADSNTRRTLYVLLAFVIAGFLVRLAIVLYDGNLWKPLSGDDLQYHGLAVSLASGRGFSLDGFDVINRMPGYPGLLALLYLVTGPSVAWARLLNVVLGTLCIPLTYLIGNALWGRRIGLAAAALLAVDPFHAVQPLAVAAHNLQVPLVTLLGALLLWAKQSFLQAELIGVVAALAVMTHPATLPIVAAALLWYLIYGRSKQVPFRHYIFLAVTFLLIMSSWTVRNWLLVGGFVPLTSGVESSGGGFVFWISNNDLTAQPGEYWGRFIPAKEYPNMPDFSEYSTTLASGDVILLDRKGYEYGFKFITTHPEQLPSLLLGKMVGFLQPKLFAVGGEPEIPLLGFVLVPLYAIGLVVHWRRSLKGRLAVAFVAGALVLALVYWGDARFRAPVEPFLLLAFILGVLELARWIRRITDRTDSPLLTSQADT